MVKIFYDTETTGTNPRLHCIHQLAGLIEQNGQIVEEFNFYMRPHADARIEPEALKVCNKTKDELLEYPSMEAAHKEFVTLLSKYINRYDRQDKAWLVGFNNRAFDDVFLRTHFELCDDAFFGSWFWSDSLDVLVLASEFLVDRRGNMPSFKLMRVAKELGIEVVKDGLHDARFDARLTREIYRIVTRKTLAKNDDLY